MNLSIFVSKVQRFIQLSVRQKKLFIKAFFLSGIIRFMILVIPFKRIKHLLGEANEESSYEISILDHQRAKQIRDIAIKACDMTPWQSKCLVRAMVVQRLLIESKIESTLYLGVRRMSEDKLGAHAWLRCGQKVLTGAYEARQYTQVAKFRKGKS